MYAAVPLGRRLLPLLLVIPPLYFLLTHPLPVAPRPHPSRRRTKPTPKRNQISSSTQPIQSDVSLRFAHDPPNPTNPNGDLSCFIYDRPPRSGSTTIGRALRSCMVDKLGFEQMKGQDLQDEYQLVQKMFTTLSSTRRATVSKHLKLSHQDLRDIRTRCRNLFYVSSCRDMKERIWSRQKYRFKPGNVNSTLSKEDHDFAVKKMLADTRNEPFLEAHPYMNRDESPNGVSEEEKLVPDYVIRNVDGLFTPDLNKLLQAAGCQPEFSSTNIHQNEQDGQDVLSLLQLKMGNLIFRKLKAHGDRVNEGGLHRLKVFMKKSMQM